MHTRFAERGIAVFAYDGRGFGRTALDEQHRSPGSSYGKTTWRDQFADIEWAVWHVKKEFGEAPVFLMGHSMVH
jgi:acylglycerol lipase